jgi:hypothetical protein
MTGDASHNDALAAEYVLGTLDSDERSQAQALLASDEGFVARVKQWERRLGELHLMVEPVEPDGKIWERIKAKVPAVPPSPELKLPETPAEPVVEPAPIIAAADDKQAEPTETPAEASPAIVPEAPASLPADVAPAAPETSWAPRLNARAPSPTPASPAPTPPVLTPAVTRAASVRTPDDAAARAVPGRPGPWQAVAMLMMLVVVAVAGLVAAWRFAPEHVPAPLQPVQLMRLVGVNIGSGPPPRRPAPPESQFDE